MHALPHDVAADSRVAAVITNIGIVVVAVVVWIIVIVVTVGS
jgi:hypothetical protein